MVERLHRRLKDALKARAAAANWSEEIHWVLLGLRAQPREDNGLSPAESVFGSPLVLPSEFLKNDECSVDSIVEKFKNIDAPAFSLLGTTAVGTCQTSYLLTSPPPASSGFAAT